MCLPKERSGGFLECYCLVCDLEAGVVPRAGSLEVREFYEVRGTLLGLGSQVGVCPTPRRQGLGVWRQ